jgi:glycine/D-amino acid oxidase-like deaminating enzyme
MIITEPLPASAWDELGWEHFDTIEDLAHVYAYVQRTPDGRIALGGRGDPYRFGSRTDTDGSVPSSTVEGLTAIVREWFPAARDVPIAHAWSGVLGVPRTWRATVGHDPATGLGWGGGYVGTGVAATNLAARTLVDLITGSDTPLTRLPWVNQRARRWEIEPLRFLGIQGIYAAYRAADRHEARGGARTSPFARVADLISGR